MIWEKYPSFVYTVSEVCEITILLTHRHITWKTNQSCHKTLPLDAVWLAVEQPILFQNPFPLPVHLSRCRKTHLYVSSAKIYEDKIELYCMCVSVVSISLKTVKILRFTSLISDLQMTSDLDLETFGKTWLCNVVYIHRPVTLLATFKGFYYSISLCAGPSAVAFIILLSKVKKSLKCVTEFEVKNYS